MEILDTKQAGEILGITSRHVTKLCREGKLTAMRFGRDWVIEPEAIEKYQPATIGRPRKDIKP